MAKTQRERDDEARKLKLDRINEQVENGSLTVRTMSDEEKAKWAKRREEKAGEPLSPSEQRKAAAASRRRQRRAAKTSA
jgi:hypothetical protein